MVEQRARHRNGQHGRGGAQRRLAPALAVTVGLLGGATALAAGVDLRSQVEEAGERADEVEIVQLRSQLRRVHLHETNVLMLQLFGEASAADLEQARNDRVTVRDQALERTRELSGGDGVTASEALFLYDLLDNDGLQGEWEADPSVLFDTGRAAARDSRPPDEQLDDEALALYDLMRTDAAGSQVLNDAMDAAYTAEQPEVPELMTDYVSRSEPYIRSDGGYIGPDPDEPLVDSYVYDATAVTPHPGVAEVGRRLADSRLWEYDQWIRSWQEGTPGPAPMTIAELVAEVDAVDRGVRAIVDEALDDARHEHLNEASSLRAQMILLFVAAAVLCCVAVGAAARIVRRRWREVHRNAERLSRDPLTGVGNRHALEDQVAASTRNPAYQWHLVAAVDMDRFKMINDTWGHAVGDRVLVEVAARLTSIVEGWQGSGDGIVGWVVRLGGDEFLLTLHSRAPLDEALVRRQLQEIREAEVAIDVRRPSGDGDDVREQATVALMFSVGTATAGGPCELDDLVRIADLAAYEEKAARAATMPDRRRPTTSTHRAVDETSSPEHAG